MRAQTARPDGRLQGRHVLAGEEAAGDGAADGEAEHVHGVVHAAGLTLASEGLGTQCATDTGHTTSRSPRR